MKAKRKRIYLILLATSIFVFVLTAILAAQKTIFPWEKDLLLAIYHLPASWRGLGLLITQFGSAWILVGVAFWLLIGHTRKQHIGRLIVLNGAIAYVIVEATKHLIQRGRPAMYLSEVHQRDVFVHGFGFPSGHTAMATVISLTLLPFLPKKWRWIVPVWIVAVGLSRIYLGVHAPLDIMGGFAIGVGVISAERVLRVQ